MASKGIITRGVFKLIPVSELTAPLAAPVPDRLYEATVTLQQQLTSVEEALAVREVWRQLRNMGVRVTGVEAKNNTVKVQFMGLATQGGCVTAESVPWFTVISGLPGILWGLGLVIGFITIAIFVSAVPSWGWGILMTCVGVAAVGYTWRKAKS